MLAGRMLALSDARLPEFRAMLEARMREASGALAGSFEELFDATMREVLLRSLRDAGAHEGTVWLLDAERTHLVPQFNSGPRAAEFVRSFRQSLRAGMISMVVATEMPICENDLEDNRQRDPRLDQQLGLRTCAMIAVPFYYAGELRGVISGVQLQNVAGEECATAGFTVESLRLLQHAATVLSRLIEHRLGSVCIGAETWD